MKHWSRWSENDCLKAYVALREIANREPELDTMPIGEAFRNLREVTRLAKTAVS